jgi:hypothetical protein
MPFRLNPFLHLVKGHASFGSIHQVRASDVVKRVRAMLKIGDEVRPQFGMLLIVPDDVGTAKSNFL